MRQKKGGLLYSTQAITGIVLRIEKLRVIVTSAGQRERLQQAKKLLPGYNQMRLGFRQYSFFTQTFARVSITLLELQHLL